MRMDHLIISLAKNQLKISINGKNGFEGREFEVPPHVADDSKILNIEEFTQLLKGALSEFQSSEAKSASLIFLTEPHETHFRYIVNDKNVSDVELDIMRQAKEKMADVTTDFEELYFSHQKVAPFVNQFIAMKKPDLDQYLEISTTLGRSLHAVLPWVLLLPKFLVTNDPCVFIIKNTLRNVIALAELNGIYYCEEFDGDKSVDEIKSLVEKLSVYKRAEPIQTIYTISDTKLGLSGDFDVNPLTGLIGDNGEAAGYEVHLLTEYILNKFPDYVYTQINSLNLLPVPMIVKKESNSMVYVGATALALVLLVGGFIGYSFFGPQDETAVTNSEVAVVTDTSTNSQEVLGDSETSEDTNNEQITDEEAENQDNEQAVELNREEINVRIENGAGIPGIAGKTQSFLGGLGYNVVSIGNSDTSARTTTLVKVSENGSKYLDLLQDDMGETFEVEIDESLEADLGYDVLVVVGSDANI